MAKCSVKFLWLLTLLTLGAILLTVLLSGDILLYLAPRMVPMVWFGLAVLAVLCVHQGYETVRCFREQSTASLPRWGLVLFFVPVLLILTATPDTNTPGSLPNQVVRLLNPSTSEAEASGAGEESTVPENNGTGEYIPCVLMNERAVFDPQADFFADYLLESAAELEGRTVTLYGFVYRDDSFEDDTFLIARQMINCCAADASIVGFHVQVNPGIDLQLNEWVRVTGTIQTKNMLYYGDPYDFPVLTSGIILLCDTPAAEYVYISP